MKVKDLILAKKEHDNLKKVIRAMWALRKKFNDNVEEVQDIDYPGDYEIGFLFREINIMLEKNINRLEIRLLRDGCLRQ